MSQSKRIPRPRLDQLVELSDQQTIAIDNLLSFPVESIKDSQSDLTDFVNQLKDVCKDFTSACNDTIYALRSSGATSQANELIHSIFVKRREAKSRISVANEYLLDIGIAETFSNLHTEFGCAPRPGGRSLSVLNDFADEPNEQYPHSVANSNLSLENSGGNPFAVFPKSSEISDYHTVSKVSPSSHSFVSRSSHPPNRSIVDTIDKRSVKSNPFLPNTNYRAISIEADASLPPASPDSIQISDHYIPHLSSFSNQQIPTRPFHNPKDLNLNHEQEFEDQGLLFPKVGRAIKHNPNGLDTRNEWKTPYVHPSETIKHQPQEKMDSVGIHLVKQQMFSKSPNPFSGEPQRYNSWISALNNKLSGINLSSYDKLLILEANTIGEPLKLVQKCMAVGGSNTERTLSRVLYELREEFGSSIKIANALNNQIDSFPTIKSVHQIDKMKELLYLCEYILANMSDARELSVFDTAYGAQRIWLKLPESFQNSWRGICDDYRCHNENTYPPFSQFVKFLEKKTREYSDPIFLKTCSKETSTKGYGITLKTSEEPHIDNCVSAPESTPSENNPPSKSEVSNICQIHSNSKHSLKDCRAFLKLTHSEKISLLRDNNLCFLCTGNHLRSKCNLSMKCDVCNGVHLTLLHPERTNKHIGSYSQNSSNLCTKVCNNSSDQRNCSKVLLVDVTLKNSSKSLRCYAIIDEQSSASFADPKVAEFFSVQGPSVDYSLGTLTGSTSNTRGILLEGLKVKGVDERRRFVLPPVLTNPFIPDCKAEVATSDVVLSHPHLQNLAKHFADLDHNAEVLLLIGRDSGPCMYTRCYGNKAPFAHHTALGWALVGGCCTNSTKNRTSNVLKVCLAEHFSQSPVFNASEKWHLPNTDIFEERGDDESLGMSKNNERFLGKLCSGIDKSKEGNIVLPLPFKKDDPLLPDNHVEVYCRTRNSLKRLSRNEGKLSKCLKVMGQYIRSNHVEVVPVGEQVPKRRGHAWWIPVFPVSHPKKDKIRIVFDSSAKYSGICLNDVLLPGPDSTNRLTDVLIGFRNGKVGFSADIEAMFHNFHLKDNDRDYMRFYWFRDNVGSNDIVQYRARVHIFGNCSSPAIANLGLRFAANESHIPCVQNFVNEQFYVDDGLAASDSSIEAINTLDATRKVLSQYNIRLHKICSSDPKVVEAFPESERADCNTIDLEKSSTQTALGLEWDTSKDTIVIKSNVLNRPFTRRGILATVNSVFDPLRISSPIVLHGKHIQRNLLSTSNRAGEHSWDSELQEDHKDEWLAWKYSLSELSGLVIPRSYVPVDFGLVVSTELHGFCDASNEGTGYVIYLKSVDDNNLRQVSFVLANSKIVPRSPPTIPRLELCAALELALTIEEVARKLNISNENIFLYSDSMIVLGYLRNVERQFPRYVTRRISMILKHSKVESWRYVSTCDNPADIASRKQSISSLLNSCWLTGPDFLLDDHYHPEETPPTELPESLDETKCFKTLKSNTCEITSLIKRSSCMIKVVRIVQKLLDVSRGYSDRCRQRLGFSLAPRGPTSYGSSLIFVVRVEQEKFVPLVNSTVKNELTSLSPFLDEQGLIRVGGRLRLSDIEYDQKYPIFLPSDSSFTRLLMSHYHSAVKHQGRCITLSAIRNAGYFIFHASKSIRRFISTCVICHRLRLDLATQRMSDLPKDRLECVPPFTNSGMDVFGPYQVTDGKSTRRSNSTKKCWALIFTCLNSRASHIEPLPYLDTSTLKNAIRRFVCIRGPVRRLRSDQGSNFIGVLNQEVADELSQNNCEWILTPPKASHHGGIWERQIQTIKKLLNVCLFQLGTRLLSRDDLYTYLQECCAILNNTPMWEFSSDPNDPRPLTPAMILTLRCNQPNNFDHFSPEDFLTYGAKRWRRVQYLSDQFWSRWRNDYLQTLQQRRKWHYKSRSFQPGDLVVLKDRTCKRYQWPIARVVAVKHSSDTLVRSVDLLVANRSGSPNLLTRPITDLGLLVPREDSSANF